MQTFRLKASLPQYLILDDPTPPGDNPPTPPAKTFTQEEVNALLAKNKTELRTQLATAQDTIKKLQEEGLTPETKQELLDKLQQQQDALLSTQELAKRDRERAENKLKGELDASKKSEEAWRTKYTNKLIETEILSAGVLPESKAVNPTQLLSMLRNNASVVEVDGKDVVHLDIIVSDGKAMKQLKLPAKEALAEFAKDPNNANLFVTEGNGGLGRRQSQITSGDRGSLKGMSLDDYSKQRKELLS